MTVLLEYIGDTSFARCSLNAKCLVRYITGAMASIAVPGCKDHYGSR